MDYLKIVLTGYLNPDTLPFLENYFFRELEEAQTKNYSPNEFYTGCYNVCRAFEKDLAEKLQKRKSEINEQRVAIANVIASETDEKERKELEQMKDSLFKESKQLTIGDFEVNLLAQKWGGHNIRLNTSDILIIEEALKSAYLKICPPPKSEDEVFEDLIKETNDAMEGKSFHEKVEWFQENADRTERVYGSDEGKHLDYTLVGENLFASSFATYRKKRPNVTIQDFIELQIEYLKGVIERQTPKTSDEIILRAVIHSKKQLKYLESLQEIDMIKMGSSDLFIEDLTIDKLDKLGFSSDSIKKLNSKEPYECFHIPALGNYIFASNISKKIYTDIEGARKQYFRNENQVAFPIDWVSLMPEYYQIKWNFRSKIEKKIKQSAYDALKVEATFLNEQIELVEKELKKYSNPVDVYSKHIFDGLQEYLRWLQVKLLNLTQLPIALKLLGQTGNFNKSNTPQPVYHYIKPVLREYSLTPLQAKEILLDLQGAFSPEWNKNVTPRIVEYLNQISDSANQLPILTHTTKTDFNNPKFNEDDIKSWFPFRPIWNQIAWQRNTEKAYQDKQELFAYFWNNYIQYEQKMDAFVKKYGGLPIAFLNDLIYKFRQRFPKNDSRFNDINYFDDLIDLLIQKYQPTKETVESERINTHKKSSLKPIGSNKKTNYSFKQIAIAYCAMNITIDTVSAPKILKKHTSAKTVRKFLEYRVYDLTKLVKIDDNKSNARKDLNDLKAAKELALGVKNQNAANSISTIISQFEVKFEAKHS